MVMGMEIVDMDMGMQTMDLNTKSADMCMSLKTVVTEVELRRQVDA